jgi:hypothetical protein
MEIRCQTERYFEGKQVEETIWELDLPILSLYCLLIINLVHLRDIWFFGQYR